MLILSLFITLISFLFFPGRALAVYDPLSVPNNKIGIHLLFPDEIHTAAQLVNRHGEASWGYVVIPIQASDRDRSKWQEFLNKCREEKIIPIIRIATVADGSHWIIPNDYDLVDFANFLNDLKWPVQNRYLIFFNEVNRADEYGGAISPESYADMLNRAIDLFKQRSPDFFILPAGLDNAASDRRSSIPWKEYLWRMHRQQPDLFNKLDGWTSHAYPNPDFSVRPDLSGSNKIDSFKYDLAVIKNFTAKKLPVFITEAGWSGRYLSDQQIAFYYQHALSRVWSDPDIVAVTPFLLNAQDGPFRQFSFLDEKRNFKDFAVTFAKFAQNGEPPLSIDTVPLQLSPENSATAAILGTQNDSFILWEKLYHSLRSLFGLFK